MCNSNRWKHSKYQVGDVDKYVVLEVRVPWKIITGSKLDTSKWNVILSCFGKGWNMIHVCVCYWMRTWTVLQSSSREDDLFSSSSVNYKPTLKNCLQCVYNY